MGLTGQWTHYAFKHLAVADEMVQMNGWIDQRGGKRLVIIAVQFRKHLLIEALVEVGLSAGSFKR